MPLNVTQEMRDKLTAVGDTPILDSVFGKNSDGTQYEKTQGTKGYYISAESDGYALRGPFEGLLGA